MQALREWAFAVCAAMVACGIALQIMPKSNLEGVFKLVVSMFFLCILLSPIMIRLPQERIVLEEYSTALIEEKSEQLRQVVEQQTQAGVNLRVQKIIEGKLRQMGIKYHDVTININTNGQSDAADSAEIVLDESMRPQHEDIGARLTDALQMDVRIQYAEKGGM